ncbi:MAG: UPF0179 family protein [Methanoregulaceae archaeon]|jgi:hypothetical protein|nr:UPF0179 family protein [Methanolinea sp.]MDD5047944.1 UPF0179 family protein [Methanoregulaceae archaeon]MDD5684858.1 UPF0179 family protein [Methanoregulaceae archaeon]HRX33014.1 UPF0179 family protein [Methanoregulaceae archaeon]
MAELKSKVTLIGTELAQTGLEFVYEGMIPDCESCPVKKACNNLKVGKKYRVVGIRPTRHACSVHLNGAQTVEVVESPIPALISADMAIRNTKILFEFACSRENCTNYDLCHPEGIIEGEKYVVMDVIGNAPDICEKGRNLQLVELMPV